MISKRKRSKKKPPRQLAPLDLNQRYDLKEAAEYLRIGFSTINRNIALGSIATIKEGGKRFVSGLEIARKSASPASTAAA